MNVAKPCASPNPKKAAAARAFSRKCSAAPAPSRLLAKGQLQLMKNPLDALKTAEQVLNSDANSAAGHKLLAEAALAADLPKTAVLSLQIVVKNSPKDEDAQKALARAYSAPAKAKRPNRFCPN